MLSRPAAV